MPPSPQVVSPKWDGKLYLEVEFQSGPVTVILWVVFVVLNNIELYKVTALSAVS